MSARTGPALLILALAVLASACGGSDDDPVDPGGPRRFLFAMKGQSGPEDQFVAATSDPGVLARVEAELRRSPGERTLHIHGPVAHGNGGHNLTWSWHFVPSEWDVVEVSVELCDGTPSDVESDVDAWVELGAFCPWSSVVVREL